MIRSLCPYLIPRHGTFGHAEVCHLVLNMKEKAIGRFGKMIEEGYTFVVRTTRAMPTTPCGRADSLCRLLLYRCSWKIEKNGIFIK